MARAEASIEERIDMIERGELRLPEMQRRYVWCSTRVRDDGYNAFLHQGRTLVARRLNQFLGI